MKTLLEARGKLHPKRSHPLHYDFLRVREDLLVKGLAEAASQVVRRASYARLAFVK